MSFNLGKTIPAFTAEIGLYLKEVKILNGKIKKEINEDTYSDELEQNFKDIVRIIAQLKTKLGSAPDQIKSQEFFSIYLNFIDLIVPQLKNVLQYITSKKNNLGITNSMGIRNHEALEQLDSLSSGL